MPWIGEFQPWVLTYRVTNPLPSSSAKYPFDISMFRYFHPSGKVYFMMPHCYFPPLTLLHKALRDPTDGHLAISTQCTVAGFCMPLSPWLTWCGACSTFSSFALISQYLVARSMKFDTSWVPILVRLRLLFSGPFFFASCSSLGPLLSVASGLTEIILPFHRLPSACYPRVL